MRYFVGIDLSSWKRGTAHVLSVQNMVSRNTGKKMNVNETKRLSELEIKKLFSDEHLIMASQSDKAVIDFFNERIDRIEKAVLKEVKLRYPYEELLTAPGVGENMWFCNMLGIDVSAPPLPEKETRLEFIKRYAEDSGKRLASLKEKNDAWWEEEVNFFQCKEIAFLDCYKENRSHSTPSRSNDDVTENDGKINLQHVWSFCGYRWFDAKQSSDYLSIYKY
ncbi:MAG TPA: hypothetical protein VI727_06605 [Candidatus Brocadiaceae bacterium]|nr:hypothetical protein [Candidatus Brocadiaceae bacterium]